MAFRWVPANATPSTLDLDLYITYEKNKVKKPTPKGEGKTRYGGYKRSIIKCPDRTIILATKSEYRPLDTSFDEHLSLSAFRDNNPFDEIGIGLVCGEINPGLSKKPIIVPKNQTLLGDCVSKDSLISTKTGFFDFYDLEVTCGVKFKPGWNTIEGLRTSFGNSIKSVYRSNKKKIYGVFTSCGFKLKGSKKHKVKVLDEDHVTFKRIRDLKEGDSVLHSYGVGVFSKNEYDLSCFDFEGLVEEQYKNMPDYIECALCGNKFKQLDSHLYFKHDILPSVYVKKYGGLLRGKETYIKSSLNTRLKIVGLPKKMNKSLALFLGWMTANGRLDEFEGQYTVEISFGENRYSALGCVKLCKNLFPGADVNYYKTLTPKYKTEVYVVTSSSRELFEFIKYCGFKTGSKNKCIPYSVLQSKKESVISFLRGYFDGDGYSGPAHVEVFSVSKKLLYQVQTILLSLEIVSFVKYADKYYSKLPNKNKVKQFGYNSTLTINSLEAEKFIKTIGFFNPDKYNFVLGKKYRSPKKYRLVEISGKLYVVDEVAAIKKSKKKKDLYDLNIENRHEYECNSFIVHNSGGFQLVMGRTDFLDPFYVIDWMNKNNVTVAASVDVFPRKMEQDVIDEELTSSAFVSRENNIIYKRYRRKGMKIMNVIHGLTPMQQEYWASVVNDEDIESWAVGSDSKSIYTQLSGISVLRNRFPKDHYHIFGVSSTEISLIMCWLGKYVPLLTSDSTTHFRAAVNKEVPFMDINGIISRKYVGEKGDFVKTRSSVLPCSCPVCSRIKYLSIFGMDAKYKVDRLASWHSMFVMTRQAEYWNKVAEQSTFDEYFNLISHALVGGTKKRIHRIHRLLSFIETSMRDSTQKAYKEHKHDFFALKAEHKISATVTSDYRDKEEKVKTVKSRLKTRDSIEVIPFIGVDCLPNYMHRKDLIDYFALDPKAFTSIYKPFIQSKKARRQACIDKRGTAEVFDKKYIRKYPTQVLNEMRSTKLKSIEIRRKHNERIGNG